ncbi:unnamed protein product [Rotaria sordida]|uniref:Uncharacterized protein n=1 Tax=Rotaria sordida TaxID=392033 RepID=A0A815ULN3_9BILA|nr:unnamed protein product [Rotaria sordida]CAF3663144.1 unnamed protein product [Rotaria sordida]
MNCKLLDIGQSELTWKQSNNDKRKTIINKLIHYTKYRLHICSENQYSRSKPCENVESIYLLKVHLFHHHKIDASSQITVKGKYYVSLVWYTYSNDSEIEINCSTYTYERSSSSIDSVKIDSNIQTSGTLS